MANRISPEDFQKWRRDLAEEGDGEHLNPTLAQHLAPRLMAEIELLWAERKQTKR